MTTGRARRRAARRTFALALSLVLAVVAGTGAVDSDSQPSIGSGSAIPTMLSSFSPLASDRIIVGGTQAISVVNTSDRTAQVTIPLEPAPCDCSPAAHDASAGDVRFTDGTLTWVIAALAPGASATLEVTWDGP